MNLKDIKLFSTYHFSKQFHFIPVLWSVLFFPLIVQRVYYFGILNFFFIKNLKKKSQNKPQSNKCSIIFIFVRNIFGRSTELLDEWLNDTRSVRKISNTPRSTSANFEIYSCFGSNILLQILIIINRQKSSVTILQQILIIRHMSSVTRLEVPHPGNKHILRIFTSQTKSQTTTVRLLISF